MIDRRRAGTFGDGPMSGVEWVQDASGNYIPGSWVGTPLADVTGWIGTGKTTLAELSTKGGSILLKAGGSVITREGSLLDVSGGSVRYADGCNNTTKLRTANGAIIDIGDAQPDQMYIALANGFTRYNARWGITETWTSIFTKSRPTFERGYTEGRDAGSIQIYSGGTPILEGDVWGGVIAGERQAALGNLAKAGTFTVGGNSGETRGWSLGQVVISDAAVTLPADLTATAPINTAVYGAMRDDKKRI